MAPSDHTSNTTKWIRNISAIAGVLGFLATGSYTLYTFADEYYIDKYELRQSNSEIRNDVVQLATSVKNIGVDYVESKIIEVKGDIDYLRQKRANEGLTSNERRLLATAEVRLSELENTLRRLRNANFDN